MLEWSVSRSPGDEKLLVVNIGLAGDVSGPGDIGLDAYLLGGGSLIKLLFHHAGAPVRLDTLDGPEVDESPEDKKNLIFYVNEDFIFYML